MIRAVSNLARLIAKSKRPKGPTRRRKICTERDQSRFEEEQLPWYRPDQFYPVHIGEVFKERYHVVGKLGYGAHSTVWLCRDRVNASFVALKICTRGRAQSSDRELRFYEHLSSLDSQHPGQAYVRGLFEAFKIESHTGDHLCLVLPPMHMTIRELQRQNESRRLTEQLLKWTLSNVLSALSFLHDDASVIHTDINPSNIMLTIADQSILFDFEKQEAQYPSPKKVVESGRAIYGTRRLGLPKDALWGQPVLCDFGEARIGQVHNGLIQPELYRAPEVLFGMEWTSSVDIWNVATLIWDLFEDRHLFNALDENNESSATHHIAEMVSFLGLPPLEYLRRSEITRNVFHENGSWKSAGGVSLPPISLEKAELYLEGEEKRRFLHFVRSMLTWLPEERKRATEILEDPWLRGESP